MSEMKKSACRFQEALLKGITYLHGKDFENAYKACFVYDLDKQTIATNQTQIQQLQAKVEGCKEALREALTEISIDRGYDSLESYKKYIYLRHIHSRVYEWFKALETIEAIEKI